MPKAATIKDCRLITAYMYERVTAVKETTSVIGEDFTPAEEADIVKFFETLTDVELGYVNKYAYLMRNTDE